MRRYVLPKLGYIEGEDEWMHPTEPAIPRQTVVDHYTRLMKKLIMRHGEAAVRRWLDRIIKLERAT